MNNNMTRRGAREAAMHILYELIFHPEFDAEQASALTGVEAMSCWRGELALYDSIPKGEEKAYIEAVVEGVRAGSEQLEEQIAQHAEGWSLARISKITLILMKIALFESRHIQGVTVAVAVNEAVALCKRYDSEEAAAFLNGVLGSIVRAEEAP